MSELLWLLLPVAAASGWWWAKRETLQTDADQKKAEYFKGLNYLLNDKPDQAIEVFSRIVQLDKDLIETHLTLGNLFRRRGEVDRAIQIHHNLSNRSGLPSRQRHRAMLELADDYMRAGLFDRAENLYRALCEQSEHTAAALNRLVDIYEQEKDWRQALEHCDRLEQTTGQVRKTEAAQYCCELADEALHRGDGEQALDWLSQALTRDANCVRASIMRGQIAFDAGDAGLAADAYRGVARQDVSYVTEVVDRLAACYQQLGHPKALLRYLRGVHAHNRSGRLTVALAGLLASQDGAAAATGFLEAELNASPSFLALRYLVELKVQNDATDLDHLQTLYKASRRMLNEAVHYQCDNCGFTAKSLYWHCPGCKRWSTVKPLPDMLFRAA